MIDYRLYLVTDDPSRYAGNWLERIVAALDGGVTCVQYRDTENDAQTQYTRILQLRDVLRARRIPLIVNNDPDLAAAVQAEGVHVGQGDRAPAEVRRLVGTRCEIGLSITSPDQLDNHAKCDAADCFGIGPVFDATKTKADAATAMGPDGLRHIVELIGSRPTVAIGGITLEDAAAVLKTGVGGLAVVSALSQAQDPTEAARQFLSLFT